MAEDSGQSELEPLEAGSLPSDAAPRDLAWQGDAAQTAIELPGDDVEVNADPASRSTSVGAVCALDVCAIHYWVLDAKSDSGINMGVRIDPRTAHALDDPPVHLLVEDPGQLLANDHNFMFILTSWRGDGIGNVCIVRGWNGSTGALSDRDTCALPEYGGDPVWPPAFFSGGDEFAALITVDRKMIDWFSDDGHAVQSLALNLSGAELGVARLGSAALIVYRRFQGLAPGKVDDLGLFTAVIQDRKAWGGVALGKLFAPNAVTTATLAGWGNEASLLWVETDGSSQRVRSLSLDSHGYPHGGVQDLFSEPGPVSSLQSFFSKAGWFLTYLRGTPGELVVRRVNRSSAGPALVLEAASALSNPPPSLALAGESTLLFAQRSDKVEARLITLPPAAP